MVVFKAETKVLGLQVEISMRTTMLVSMYMYMYKCAYMRILVRASTGRERGGGRAEVVPQRLCEVLSTDWNTMPFC